MENSLESLKIKTQEFVENIFDKTSLDELESFYKKRKM